jgi:hypothetical protein
MPVGEERSRAGPELAVLLLMGHVETLRIPRVGVDRADAGR